MSQSIAIRREGDLIVIEDIETIKGEDGVLKTTYLDADAALRLFGGAIVIARTIKADGGKRLPLAVVPDDSYPEDRQRAMIDAALADR